MKHITIRMDEDLHKRVKYRLIEEDKSIQKYVIDLIENDLNKEDKGD